MLVKRTMKFFNFKSALPQTTSITALVATASLFSSPMALAKDPIAEKKVNVKDAEMLEKSDEKSEWVQLFNGKDLTGWTPKFKGSKLGINYKNVFKVKDGVLVVDYSEYGDWDGKFGHLFYEKEFSHYILRAEYRFVGEQSKNGPKWALRNNGFMIHGQTPETMELKQDFPNSIEVQLLGGPEEGERSNLSICTPGTHIEKDGKLIKKHVIKSKGPTNRGDEWYSKEVEVKGSEVIRHKQDGKVIMEYNKPQLNDGTLLEKGTISIQSESHHTEFRKIEIKEIKK